MLWYHILCLLIQRVDLDVGVALLVQLCTIPELKGLEGSFQGLCLSLLYDILYLRGYGYTRSNQQFRSFYFALYIYALAKSCLGGF